MSIRTVLFDLDGTLADTAPDLAYALNTLLAEHGRPELAFSEIRPIVSHGAAALVTRGFAIGRENPSFEGLRARLLEIYRQNLTTHTKLFDGMRPVLEALAGRGVSCGIVTNKPAFLTEPLVDQLGLRSELSCIVSGDTTTNRKPHPEPMIYACRLAGSNPAECLYVGDAERDIAAGRAAGMRTLVALFGYIGLNDEPGKWGADGLLNSPGELLDWLD